MAWAITAALYHRQKTGEGQKIEASLLLTALALQPGFREIVAFDEEARRERLARLTEARARGADIHELYELRRSFQPELAGNIYYRPYKTKDGYIVVGALGPGPRRRFCEALGIHDPRYDEGFERTPENLRRVGEELVRQCEAIFLERTTEEWIEHLDRHDVACGPVRFIEELWDDPQVIENEYIVEYEHTLLGKIRSHAPIVRLSGTPTRVPRASPALGEHTDEGLREVGFGDEEIAELRRCGAIR